MVFEKNYKRKMNKGGRERNEIFCIVVFDSKNLLCYLKLVIYKIKN